MAETRYAKRLAATVREQASFIAFEVPSIGVINTIIAFSYEQSRKGQQKKP
jgi:hypothetical protein